MKKNNIKKILALALNLIIVGSSAVGCFGGGGGNNSSSGGGQGDGPIVATEYGYETGIDFSKPLPLVENGIAQYDILVRADVDATVTAAVNEFNDYLADMTGVSLPIVKEGQGTVGDKYISIGATNASDEAGIDPSGIKWDGYLIKTVGDDFYITGNDEIRNDVNATSYQRGTKFGIYTFMERFMGVRWLTATYTYVPRPSADKTLTAYECDIVDEPEFEMRDWFGGDSYNYPEFFAHCKFFSGDTWDPTTGSGHNTNLYMNFNTVDPSDPDGRTLGETHPEYFTTHTNTHAPTREICPSNGVLADGTLAEGQSVASLFIDKIKACLEEDKETKKTEYFFIGHVDDRSAVCHCTTCDSRRAEIFDAGIWVMFLNLIEEHVNSWLMETQGREVKFLHFAYQYAERPPVVENEDGTYSPINDLVVCDPNVGSRIAAISANYNYAFSDPRQNEADILTMYGWSAVCSLFMIWDYQCNFEEFYWYFPTTHTLKDNLLLYKDMGVVFVMNQSTWNQPGIWFDVMRNYVSSRLFWNLNWNVTDLINEFIDLYYDAAAEDVKEVYKLFDDNYASYRMSMDTMAIAIFNSKTFLGTTYLKLEFLNRVLTKIDTTMAKVPQMTLTTGITPGELMIRLENIRITPMTMILRNYTSYYSEDTKLAYAKEYFDLCESHNIKFLGESTGRTLAKKKATYGL